MQHPQLSVNVSGTFTLDAGWWEETMEETVSGKPLPCRLIHPPEPTMYYQVLRHLETISRETRIPAKSQLNFGEVGLATIAVCLRWGTYFAVLADQTKPIWSQTEQEAISMIGDEEMARIDIEASAALAQWIVLMRANDSHFRKMVKAAQALPMLPPLLDENTNNKLYRTSSFINSAQSRQNFFAMLKEQYGDEWLEQKRADIMPNPTRWLANGLINAYWRNKSGIEDIHAGEREARPLLQRRITPRQEYTIVQKVAEGIVPSMHAIYHVLHKKSEDDWDERVLSLAINFSPPDYWSLSAQSTEVLLEGAES
ncbi:MAG TPA: hypothetical protein VIX20_12225 [Ktedonobacteraceae bacterium]